MIKLAKIIKINESRVVLKLEKNTQCSDCKSRCSDGFLSFLFNKKQDDELIVDLKNNSLNQSHLLDENAFFNEKHQVNDVIGFKFDESELMKLSLVLYGLPIVLLVLTIVLGSFVFEILKINADIGGVLGLVLGFLLAKYVIKSNYFKIKPQVSFFN